MLKQKVPAFFRQLAQINANKGIVLARSSREENVCQRLLSCTILSCNHYGSLAIVNLPDLYLIVLDNASKAKNAIKEPSFNLRPGKITNTCLGGGQRAFSGRKEKTNIGFARRFNTPGPDRIDHTIEHPRYLSFGPCLCLCNLLPEKGEKLFRRP